MKTLKLIDLISKYQRLSIVKQKRIKAIIKLLEETTDTDEQKEILICILEIVAGKLFLKNDKVKMEF